MDGGSHLFSSSIHKRSLSARIAPILLQLALGMMYHYPNAMCLLQHTNGAMRLIAYNVLTKEPWVGFIPEDVRAWLDTHQTQVDLADAFAVVSEQHSILPHLQTEIRDYWLDEAYDNWSELYDDLYQQIVSILSDDNERLETDYVTTGIGRHYIAKPFIERNGYSDGHGWWTKE